MQRIFASSLLALITTAAAFAQDSTRAYLRVESNLDGSLILVDSAYVGVIGRADFLEVRPGQRRIGLAPAAVGSWVLTRPETNVTALPGDTVTVRLDFPITYRIDTTPFGATVFREDEDRSIGQTPLVFTSETALRTALILEKAGYASERIVPGSEVFNQHSVSLRALEDQMVPAGAVEWNPGNRRHRWITYSALGLVVAGGALAVHFKFEADDKYEEYLVTANPQTKDEVDRLDRFSYVALGGMQVGLGILAYRLAF